MSLFKECSDLQITKKHDYAEEHDGHSNFKFSSNFLNLFPYLSRYHIPYLILISAKLARINNLLRKADNPEHESLKDSFIDLINYIDLWADRVLRDE